MDNGQWAMGACMSALRHIVIELERVFFSYIGGKGGWERLEREQHPINPWYFYLLLGNVAKSEIRTFVIDRDCKELMQPCNHVVLLSVVWLVGTTAWHAQ